MTGPPIPHIPNAVTFTPGVSPVGTLPTFDTWATIISQYVNSPILTQLALDFYAWLDQTANFDAFYNQIWNIKTATGYGLDVWGRILGVSRILQVANMPFFGFQEATATGFFNSFFSGGSASNSVALTDSAFRTLLFAKALANISNGSIPSINRLLMTLFPSRGNAFVIDNLNLTLSYAFEFTLSASELAIVQSSGVLPRPSGVSAAVSGYLGPADINGTAKAWWGSTGYNNAYIGSNVLIARRSSDNTTKTFTLQANGTINQADTFFDGSNYFVQQLYDQSGNGLNLVQATLANQPTLTLNGQNGIPVIGGNGTTAFMATAGTLTQAQPLTHSIVARYVNNSAQGPVITPSGGAIQSSFNDAGSHPNTHFASAGTIQRVTAADGAWHVLSDVFNGASSAINVDGPSDTTGINTGAGTWSAAAIRLFSDGTNVFNGSFIEGGIWAGAWSATQRLNMALARRGYLGI